MRNKNAKIPDPNKIFTNHGETEHIDYASKVLPDGRIELTESGRWNIDEYINSFRETCDMHYILEQIKLGNLEVINQKKPMYGDFTQAPKSYAEALQLMIDGQKAFEQLPLDVRNDFDNDFNKWFATAGNADWLEKMAKHIENDKVVDETKEETA